MSPTHLRTAKGKLADRTFRSLTHPWQRRQVPAPPPPSRQGRSHPRVARPAARFSVRATAPSWDISVCRSSLMLRPPVWAARVTAIDLRVDATRHPAVWRGLPCPLLTIISEAGLWSRVPTAPPFREVWEAKFGLYRKPIRRRPSKTRKTPPSAPREFLCSNHSTSA